MARGQHNSVLRRKKMFHTVEMNYSQLPHEHWSEDAQYDPRGSDKKIKTALLTCASPVGPFKCRRIRAVGSFNRPFRYFG